MPFVEIQPLLNASCTLLFQVRARTSVGYGENSTAWDITLSTKGQPGKKIDFQDYPNDPKHIRLGNGAMQSICLLSFLFIFKEDKVQMLRLQQLLPLSYLWSQ